jgi:glycosyltransferase involved in cell wall biosynthesis
MGSGAWVKGKALFGGTAELRKGIQYYAEAARILEGSGVICSSAGPVMEQVRSRPETSSIVFLGPLRRQDFLNELRSAAVFVLPTLAEGSASVVFEALCCGVPVVTTRSAGSVVTDGKEGRIVPERDAEALAKAIKEIALDPDLRAAMSAEALRTAAEYTEEKWGARLVEALRS